MTDKTDQTPQEPGLFRLPGLYHGWDILPMLNGMTAFHIEPHGQTSDGEPLYAVWRSRPDLEALLRALS